jgi:hypothetical protein
MKKMIILFIIATISCAAGYAWSADYDMTMQPGTTFFQLNQPSPGPTMRKMNDDHDNNTLNNPQQVPQDYREKIMRQIQEQKNYQNNYHWNIENQIQNNIDQHLNQDQLQLDQSHTNK